MALDHGALDPAGVAGDHLERDVVVALVACRCGAGLGPHEHVESLLLENVDRRTAPGPAQAPEQSNAGIEPHKLKQIVGVAVERQQ